MRCVGNVLGAFSEANEHHLARIALMLHGVEPAFNSSDLRRSTEYIGIELRNKLLVSQRSVFCLKLG
jgi:hypothetical protein